MKPRFTRPSSRPDEIVAGSPGSAPLEISDRPQLAAIPLRFGPYLVDRERRRLLKEGDTVPLTTRAFDTLEVLVCRAGHTVSKGELLKEVWRGTFVQEETLTQNISTIRRALGDTSDSPRYVMTVPREGYRFIAPVEPVEAATTVDESRRVGDLPATVPRGLKRRRARRWIEVTAGSAVGLFIATAGLVLWARRHPLLISDAVPATAFEVFEPEGNRFSTSGGVLNLSPDGRHLAFLATDADGRDNLWIRPLDSLESTRVPGTVDASQPFWSPDSKSIAFFSAGALRRVDVAGGPPRTVCALPDPRALAGTWSHDDVILFALNGRGIFRVAASGGTAIPVTIAGVESCWQCRWPAFLPDGRRFLFTLVSAGPERGLYVGSLDGTPARRVLGLVSSAMYVEPGYLLYGSGGALVARRFDPAGEQAGPDALLVAEHVWYNPGTRRVVFSASDTGLLVYREAMVSRLQWVSRTCDVISTSPDGFYHSFAVSRDGHVLASQLDPLLGTYDLWLHTPAWTTATRLTFDAASELRPIWSEDESAAVFAREESRGWQLYEVKIDRPGAERALLAERSDTALGAVSWNGEVLEYSSAEPGGPGRVWSVRPGRADRAALIYRSKSEESDRSLSPDGKWLAYTINVADSRVPNTALFLRPWHDAPDRLEIAAAGSVPRWRSDGRELFFIAPGGRLMVQRVHAGHPIGVPVHMCSTPALATSGLAGQAYDAARDGQRFLIKVAARRPSIIVKSGMLPRPKR